VYIGYIRKANKPGKKAKVFAIMCKNEGLELIYINPKDVDRKRNVVNGRIYLNNEWVRIEISIPKFIDVNPYLFLSHKKLMSYLKRTTKLSIDQFGIISKYDLQKKLLENKKLSEFAIPT